MDQVLYEGYQILHIAVYALASRLSYAPKHLQPLCFVLDYIVVHFVKVPMWF
jgi:hypothetical protein